MNIDDDAAAQARAAWGLAIILLKNSGMGDPRARTYFGGVLSRHKLAAASLLPALEAGIAIGTGDGKAWIERAAQRAAERQRGDPALKAAWT